MFATIHSTTSTLHSCCDDTTSNSSYIARSPSGPAGKITRDASRSRHLRGRNDLGHHPLWAHLSLRVVVRLVFAHHLLCCRVIPRLKMRRRKKSLRKIDRIFFLSVGVFFIICMFVILSSISWLVLLYLGWCLFIWRSFIVAGNIFYTCY